MIDVLFRFGIVWVVLHIILFFVERYRYKHSSWSWYGFMNHGMLDITCIVLVADVIGSVIVIVGGLVLWILQPINI